MPKWKRDLREKVTGFIAFVSLIAVLFILGGSITGVKAKSFSEWVYHYQTLIGGFMAVVAAFFTVRQMQTTDSKQAENADAALALAVRADFLKVSRLASVTVNGLRDREREWAEYRGANQLSAADLFTKLLSVDYTYPERVYWLTSTLNHKLFAEAEPLFNGRTSELLIETRTTTSILQPIGDFLEQEEQGAFTQQEIDDFYKDAFVFMADELADALARLPDLLLDLRTELDRLERVYRRVADKSELLREL